MSSAAGARPPLFTRPFVLAALANALLNLAAFLFVHLPGFLQQLGAGEAQIGRIMAAQGFGAVVAWPLAGRTMDAHGRRVVIIAGAALFLVVVLMYVSIDGLGPHVYGIRMLDGVATALWYTAMFTYAADLVPVQRRTEGLAIFGVSGVISLGVGAEAGDVILAYTGYRELFLFALGLVAAALLLCLPLRDPAAAALHTVAPRGVVATALQRNLGPVWLAALSFFAGVVAVFTFMKTFVIATGAGSVGVFFLAYAGVAVALRILLGWVPDRLGARRMLGGAMALYVAGLIMLSLADAAGDLVLAGLLCGAGHGYTFPVLLSLVVARAPPQERGAATAFFTMLDWLALLIAGPIVGYTIERAGYDPTFMGLALLLAAGGGLFYAVDRDIGPAEAHPCG